MGYPNFGKVKTIVLPAPNDTYMTGAQYKEKYGIDLFDIFGIKLVEGNYIWLNIKEDTQILIAHDNVGLVPIDKITYTAYVSGTTNGALIIENNLIYTIAGSHSFRFMISKDAEFSLENVKVSYSA